MRAIRLATFADVRWAREYVHSLAEEQGVHDPEEVAVVTAELSNNCVEHATQLPAWMRIRWQRETLSLHFENRCSQQPTWETNKPITCEEFRTGGYGLQIARALASSLTCHWANGRAIVDVTFASSHS